MELTAVRQAEEGRDDEAEETMRQYRRLKELLHDIPTTRGRRKRTPRKSKEAQRGS